MLTFLDSVEFLKATKKISGAVILEEESIGSLLSHNSDTVRSLAFSVLVSSLSTVKPFSTKGLRILKSHMYILYSDTDAKFRNEVVSITRHMVERLRGATSFLFKEAEDISFLINSDRGLPESRRQEGRKRLAAVGDLLESHENYVTWYIQFLLLELIPTASYQRHITSLKAISLLLRSGIHESNTQSLQAKSSGDNTVWPYNLEFFTQGSLRLLMDLLLDPFEDVRSAATNILKLASSQDFKKAHYKEILETTTQGDRKSHQQDVQLQTFFITDDGSNTQALRPLEEFIRQAETLSKETGRADHADGVARSYELLYGLQTSSHGRLDVIHRLVQDLEGKVDTAERSLGQAVFDAPIHGTFAALT